MGLGLGGLGFTVYLWYPLGAKAAHRDLQKSCRSQSGMQLQVSVCKTPLDLLQTYFSTRRGSSSGIVVDSQTSCLHMYAHAPTISGSIHVRAAASPIPGHRQTVSSALQAPATGMSWTARLRA